MAIEIKYLCDSCGCHVTPENGVTGTKEFTLERGPGIKTCILVQLEDSDDNVSPVVCFKCLSALFEECSKTGSNYICSQWIS